MYGNRNVSEVKYIKRQKRQNAKEIKKEIKWNTENCNHSIKSSIKKTENENKM
jgi:hypothetical protein